MLKQSSTNSRKIYDKKPISKRKSLTSIINAEKLKANKGKGVKIVVIDTGVDLNHPELKESVKFHINMFEKSDDVTDENGHGTHVSGLIAGKTVGIAPESELYIAKSLNEEGIGTTSSVMDGITMAINIGADIICMSLGNQYEPPPIIAERIKQAYNAGIIIISATGNDGLETVDYPSGMAEVISVGGAKDNGEKHEDSNCGYEMDVIAPSYEILSSYKDGKYASITGTSMAGAITTGALALVISKMKSHGKLYKNDIQNIIYLTIRSGNHSYLTGYGMLDLEKILLMSNIKYN